MILTCPECATGYFVKDGEISPQGRTVRCASCGARWTAYPERGLELGPDAAAQAEGLEAHEALEHEEPIALTAEALPRAFRDKAEEERRMRRAAVSGVVWAGAGVALVAIVGILLLFRVSVVRAWPQTASLYAAIGLTVNPTGLTIEQVKAEPGLQDSHPGWTVSGVIRNIAGRPEVAPPLRISFLNAQGKRVAGQIARLDNARVPTGAARSFTTFVPDVPMSAANGALVVEFALGAGPRAATVKAVTTPASNAALPSFSLRGPAASGPTEAVNVALPPATNDATSADAQ